MSFIELNKISKIFKDSQRQTETLALDDISLSFEKKEFVCLLGPSGCGKSTLLNMVAGFEHPSSGDVKLDHHLITGPGADRGAVGGDGGSGCAEVGAHWLADDAGDAGEADVGTAVESG